MTASQSRGASPEGQPVSGRGWGMDAVIGFEVVLLLQAKENLCNV